MTKLILGCGYLGRRVAERWRVSGDAVTVVTRSQRRAEGLATAGFTAHVADVTQPATLVGLPPAETVLFAVGHDRTAGPSIREVYVDGLCAVLDTLQPGVQRFIYISSTGVYGQVDGDWVDEETPCHPLRAGGEACLAAEQRLAQHAIGERAIVLRLAGIYGPGRVPRRDDLLAGKPIAAQPDGYVNLIHVDDAARVVCAVAAGLAPPKTLIVSDGHPAVRRDYYAELARLYDAPAPRFDPAAIPAGGRGAGSDKRVSNARLLGELAITLEYPSYREGLAAVVRGERF